MLDERGWLALLDGLRVECDGMTRVLSALLQRDGVAHTPMVGNLDVASVGRIAVHHWIELADGRRIDLRARMWLGDDPRVPHGILPQGLEHARYTGQASHIATGAIVFWALTDRTIADFPASPFARATDRDLSPC